MSTAHRFDLRERTILLALAGSRAQGLEGTASDVDLRGVAVPPRAVLFSFESSFEQADSREEMASFVDDLAPGERTILDRAPLEGSVFGIHKLFRLALECNPNILELLFARDTELRRCTPAGERLRAASFGFLSERAAQSFAGYARGQLQRIAGHRAWLLHPPAAPPQRKDFGLPERTLLPADQLQAAEAAIQKRMDGWNVDWSGIPTARILQLQGQIEELLLELVGGHDQRFAAAARVEGLSEELIANLERERRYKASMRAWQQYQEWCRNRNPARAALEAKFGYDTKHAAHLLRLLRMGREILEEGRVIVWRGERDAEELRAVRAGALSYDALVEQAGQEEAALQARVRQGACAVPKVPNLPYLREVCVEICQSFA
jgi:predicted nucleotidyltransferase